MRLLALTFALLALPSTLLAQQIPGCGFGSVGRELGVELGFHAGAPLMCSVDAGDVVDLATQLGGNLIAWYEVPSVIDSAITVTSGRIEQLNNRAGGSNHMTAVGASERPLYYEEGGPEDEPFMRIDADSTVPLSLQATIAAPSPRRIGVYVVFASGHSGSLQTMVQVWNTVTSYPFRLRDHASLLSTATDTLRSSVRIVSTATEEIQIPGSSNSLAAAWQLYSFRNPASGAAQARLNGVLTSPNFTVTAELIDNFVRMDIGNPAGSAANTGGKIKAVIIVADPTDERDAIVHSYCEARWPSLFVTGKGAILPLGTSNSVSASPYQRYSINWAGPDWHWTRGVSAGGSTIANDWQSGDALMTQLIAAANYHVDRPLNFFGFVGENDHGGLADSLEANLNSMIAHVEATITTRAQPPTWTFVRIPSWSTRPGAATMRAAIESVVAANPVRRAWIDADDAGHTGDGIHYSAAGYELLIPRASAQAQAFEDMP